MNSAMDAVSERVSHANRGGRNTRDFETRAKTILSGYLASWGGKACSTLYYQGKPLNVEFRIMGALLKNFC